MGGSIESIVSIIKQQEALFQRVHEWEDIAKKITYPLDHITAFLERTNPRDHSLSVATRKLAKRCWFVAPHEFPAKDTLFFKYIAKQTGKVIDGQMANYVRKYADKIIERVERDFPKRSHIIHSAYNAHKRGEYVLSIPVLLAQADGICHDIFSVNLYSRERDGKNPKTKEKVTKLTPKSKSDRAALAPYTHLLPIHKSAHKYRRNRILNRNGILHGILLDYGTEVNSLQSILLLESLRELRCFVTKAKRIKKI